MISLNGFVQAPVSENPAYLYLISHAAKCVLKTFFFTIKSIKCRSVLREAAKKNFFNGNNIKEGGELKAFPLMTFFFYFFPMD